VQERLQDIGVGLLVGLAWLSPVVVKRGPGALGQPVVHFEIEGRDAAALRTFYSAIFVWDITVQADSPANYGLVQGEVNSDGVGIGGAVSEVPDEPSPTWRGQRRDEGYPGHVTVYVEVPYVEAALVQAEEMGGTRLQGPDRLMPGVQIGKFTDPEGHLIAIVTASR
jgi:predicted enzyme related to lactoylglutathione lyase